MSKSLLCCDTYDELLKVKTLCKTAYVVATNRYDFYKRERERKEHIVFLESNETNPYEKVWNILDQIHEVIDHNDENEAKAKRLFHFSYHLEGGFPTKIAQMIINLNLISGIVGKYNINEIYLFDNKDNWIINESIYLYSRSQGIECHILDRNMQGEKIYLKTLETMEKKADIEGTDIFLKEKEKVNNIMARSIRPFKRNAIVREDIGLLYCCSRPYNKHVDWCLRRIAAIGHKTRIICYYDTEDVQKFRDKGIQTDCLEDYFSTDDFGVSYSKLIVERDDILEALNRNLNVVYKGIDLSEYLLVKIRNYYYRELIDHLYMDVCAKNYFKYHHFSYIHIWGNTEFWETWICYDNTRDYDSKLFKIDNSNFISFKTKQPYQYMLSAEFTPNIQRFQDELSAAYLGKIYPIRDVFWGDISCSLDNSEIQNEKLRIGFLPTGVLGGFTTYHFYYGTLMKLIDRLLEEKYEVVFKNHPHMSECWEEDIRYRYKDNEKFIFLDPCERISRVLESCDAIITDISSSAFDAAVAQKPVFCIVDDQGYDMIKQHEQGFSIYQCMENLLKDLESISQNNEIYKAILDKQNTYMEEITGNRNYDKKESVYTLLQTIE